MPSVQSLLRYLSFDSVKNNSVHRAITDMIKSKPKSKLWTKSKPRTKSKSESKAKSRAQAKSMSKNKVTVKVKTKVPLLGVSSDGPPEQTFTEPNEQCRRAGIEHQINLL